MTAAALAAMNPNGVVVRYGIGFDNVDLDAATRLGVRVCNVPDYGADTVADHAVTLTLMLLRKVASSTAHWRPAAGRPRPNSLRSARPARRR